MFDCQNLNEKPIVRLLLETFSSTVFPSMVIYQNCIFSPDCQCAAGSFYVFILVDRSSRWGGNMNHESEVWFVKDCCGVGMSVVVCDLCDIHQLGLFTLDDDICLL